MKLRVCKPDVVILATGYNQELSFLDNAYPAPQDAKNSQNLEGDATFNALSRRFRLSRVSVHKAQRHNRVSPLV